MPIGPSRCTKRAKLAIFVALLAMFSGALAFETAEAQPVEPVTDCQVPLVEDGFQAQSGFPLGAHLAPSIGDYQAVVLFVDFPDRPSTETTQEALATVWQPEAEEFIEEQSGKRLDVEVTPEHQWLRLSKDFALYSLGAAGSSSSDIVAEAIALADPEVDFADVDSVWIVFEKTAERNGGEAWLSHGEAGGVVADEGSSRIRNALILGTYNFGQTTSDLDPLDAYVAHEVLHTIGLPDLYDWERTEELRPPEAWRFVGNFDPMGVTGGFAGGTIEGTFSTRNGNELFAWQRWQLGWLNDPQVVCVTTALPVDRVLTPIAVQGGKKALVVRLGETTALVAELRTSLRYDSDLEAEGVLVYAVDSAVQSGDGPIRVLGDHDGDWPNASGLLQVGEQVEYENYTVSVLSISDDGYEVRIDGPAMCMDQLVTINMRANGGDGTGTAGDDVILGTPGDDVIDAGDGNDLVCAGRGDDTVIGGAGDDRLLGEIGNDVLRGNAGDDILDGAGGGDRLLGGTGDDVLDGGTGPDVLGGFGGADRIQGGGGDDQIFGGFGADTIFAGAGNDIVHGLVGNDVIHGDAGDDVLMGDRGNDVINGGNGNDIIRGGNANDVLDGDSGDDEVHGGKADDSVAGGIGTDLCIGNRQNIADVAAPDCETTFGFP